jgi:hypothetical protein
VNLKAGNLFKTMVTAAILFTSCSNWVFPDHLSGTYIGKQRVMIRYEKDGQYFFRDDVVMVSLIIDSIGHVTGMVGEATFEGCNVVQNRSWIGRQLSIKTDFLIKGMLKGNTFDKDTILNKEISIPFNVENNELKGSLFLTTSGQNYPIISILKLQKR